MRTVFVVCMASLLLWGCSKDHSQAKEAEYFLPMFEVVRADVGAVLQVSIERDTRAFVLSARAGQSPQMQKLIARAQDANPQLPLEEESSDELVSRLFEQVFWPREDVLAARAHIVRIEEEDSVFKYPAQVELPTPKKWSPLRQHRLFSAVATCPIGDEEFRCVLIKLEPLGHRGSAGMTVAFKAEQQ